LLRGQPASRVLGPERPARGPRTPTAGVGRVPRHITKGGQRQCWLARLAGDRGQVIDERGAQPSRRVSARNAHLHDMSTVVDGRGEQIPHRTIAVGNSDPRLTDTDGPLKLRDRRRLVGGDHPESGLSKSLARITLDAPQKRKLVPARRPDLVHRGAILPADRREDRGRSRPLSLPVRADVQSAQAPERSKHADVAAPGYGMTRLQVPRSVLAGASLALSGVILAVWPRGRSVTNRSCER
jgi:hypothetical protein